MKRVDKRTILPASFTGIWSVERPLLQRAGVIILTIYSLFHSAALARNSILELKPAHPDAVTTLEKRFEPLTKQLSRMPYSRVGYVTNLPEDIRWMTEYLRTQYTLAPIIVSDSPNVTPVVVDLMGGSSIENTVSDMALFTFFDYGNGLFLLSRKAD